MSILNSNNFLYKTVDGVKQFFSPLVNASTVVLKDGSRLEKDGKIHADQAVNAETLGGKEPKYYLQPMNYLDNSNFKNPVNQQRATTYDNIPEYTMTTIDRWWVSTGGLSLDIIDDGIRITGSMSQNIDQPERFINKTLTFALKIKDYGIVCTSGTVTNLTAEEITPIAWMGSEGSGFGIVNFYGDLLVVLTGFQGAVLEWAALYEGEYTVDTLPPYVPKDYAVELSAAMRYCRAWGANECMMSCNANAYGVFLVFDFSQNPMRKTPSLLFPPEILIMSGSHEYTALTNGVLYEATPYSAVVSFDSIQTTNTVEACSLIAPVVFFAE